MCGDLVSYYHDMCRGMGWTFGLVAAAEVGTVQLFLETLDFPGDENSGVCLSVQGLDADADERSCDQEDPEHPAPSDLFGYEASTNRANHWPE